MTRARGEPLVPSNRIDSPSTGPHNPNSERVGTIGGVGAALPPADTPANSGRFAHAGEAASAALGTGGVSGS